MPAPITSSGEMFPFKSVRCPPYARPEIPTYEQLVLQGALLRESWVEGFGLGIRVYGLRFRVRGFHRSFWAYVVDGSGFRIWGWSLKFK